MVFRDGEIAEAAQKLRSEFCIRVVGEVRQRPAGNENSELPSGEIEVVATELEVLSEAAPLPFPIVGTADINEERRLQYRYLDLRREGPAKSLRMRSEVSRVAREVMARHRFLDIETPNLTRSTPEGARDFLVPVRLQPGHWYALPQSPQLFKQLLMVAGMERYYQIARCFRDEDFRADRQPEFTQLDIEMSFVDQDDIIALAEEVVSDLWREIVGHEITLPIPRMTYAEAITRYGSDKPDLRFGQELVDCTGLLRRHAVPGVPGAARRRGRDARRRLPDPQGARRLAGLGEVARRQGAGLPARAAGRRAHRPGREELLRGRAGRGASRTSVREPGDAVFFGAGERTPTLELLGRCPAGDRPALRPDPRRRVGVPLDRRRPDVRAATATGGWTAVHHPFTSPKPEWADTFQDHPGAGAGLRLRHRAATATSSAAARSVSTAARCSSGSST